MTDHNHMILTPFALIRAQQDAVYSLERRREQRHCAHHREEGVEPMSLGAQVGSYYPGGSARGAYCCMLSGMPMSRGQRIVTRVFLADWYPALPEGDDRCLGTAHFNAGTSISCAANFCRQCGDAFPKVES